MAENLVDAYSAGPIAAVEAALKTGGSLRRRTLMLAAGAGITVSLALYRQTPSNTRGAVARRFFQESFAVAELIGCTRQVPGGLSRAMP